ncbi:stalk domain-containing protein [Ammonifex thiophilus]|nr:stalk domain-containing protein [Ammonifex thiophilus]
MKKAARVLLGVLLLALLSVPWARAQQEQVVVKGEKPSLILFVVGKARYAVKGYCPPSVRPSRVEGGVSYVDMDVAPYIESDRTFVPVRYLANALGVDNANIHWCPKCGGKVTLAEPGFPRVEMKIGEKWVSSDGQVREIDVAPAIKDPGRTMLPARFVAEALGFEVEWLPEKQVVVCWPKGKPKPTADEIKQILEKLGAPEPPKPTGGKFIGPENNRVWVPEGASVLEGNGNYYKNGVQVGLDFDGSVKIFSTTTDCLEPGVTFDQMLATLREVLTNTFGPGEFTDWLMDVARHKDSRKKECPLLPVEGVIKTAPDGRNVFVYDGGDGIAIFVRPPGVGF